MKIYIDKFNINILEDVIDILADFKMKTIDYIELFTNEGIYEIYDKYIYELNQIDKEIVKYNNYYKNYNLIIDTSYYIKEKTNSINGIKHLSRQVSKNIYKINPTYKLKLVIENIIHNNKIKPNNIFFECDDKININDLFIKQEIIEFLSALN